LKTACLPSPASAGSRKRRRRRSYHRIERSYGNFLRSFTLPDGADGSKVNAEFKDGVLKVHLPKSERAKPKAAEVKEPG